MYRLPFGYALMGALAMLRVVRGMRFVSNSASVEVEQVLYGSRVSD